MSDFSFYTIQHFSHSSTSSKLVQDLEDRHLKDLVCNLLSSRELLYRAMGHVGGCFQVSHMPILGSRVCLCLGVPTIVN